MADDEYKVTSYRASSNIAPYRDIMNSEKMQGILLAKAKRVADKALLTSSTTGSRNAILTEYDVRPGKIRAHARAWARLRATPEGADRGYLIAAYRHNVRIDRALQGAMDAAKADVPPMSPKSHAPTVIPRNA